MHFLSTDYVWICGGKWNTICGKWDRVGLKIMKIKKQIYKVVCLGKRFSFPLFVSETILIREKVLIRKNNSVRPSYLNLKS